MVKDVLPKWVLFFVLLFCLFFLVIFLRRSSVKREDVKQEDTITDDITNEINKGDIVDRIRVDDIDALVDKMCRNYDESYDDYKDIWKIIGFNKDRYTISNEGKEFVDGLKENKSLREVLRNILLFNLKVLNKRIENGNVKIVDFSKYRRPFVELYYGDSEKIIVVVASEGKDLYISVFDDIVFVEDNKHMYFCQSNVLGKEIDRDKMFVFINQSIAAKEDISGNPSLMGKNMCNFFMCTYKPYIVDGYTLLYKDDRFIFFSNSDGEFFFDFVK